MVNTLLVLVALFVSFAAFADSISVISDGLPPIREGALAISPANPRIVLAAAIGGTSAPRADVHMFRSNDGGTTWTPLGMLPKQLGATELIGHWDPVFAFDRAGRAYITAVAAISAERWRIGVYRSDDDGTTWTGVDVADASVARNDKPWIAIDDAGGVHVVWYGFGPFGTSHVVSRDRGVSFSPPRVFPAAGWPFVATGFAGEVFLSHPGAVFNGWDILASMDRGITFGDQTRIPSLPASLPHMIAADRRSVFALMPASDGVYFSRSTDRARTWSAPTRYAGPNGAWLPSVSVDPITMEVVLTWHERVSPTHTRIMTTSSIDGGATFATPRAVTPPFEVERPMGEYNQLATYGGRHIIVWSDARGVFHSATLDARSTEAPPPLSPRRRRAIKP